MGTVESVENKKRSSKLTAEHIQEQQKSTPKLQYSNRYASPFNRTQFDNHSTSTTSKSVVKPQKSPFVLSCMTADDDTDVDSFSCVALQEGREKVNTLYDVKANNGRQIVWEYQRYDSDLGWGSANFIDSDFPLTSKVRFATYDHSHFGDSIQSVAPPIPPGWKVDMSWAIVVQKRIRKRGKRGGGDVDETKMSDRFGWHYGNDLHGDKWFNTHQFGCNLRRRAWNRVLVKRVEDNFDVASNFGDSNLSVCEE